MNTKEQLKAITDKLEESVKNVFESGKYAEYLQAMSKFHHYSLNNCLLIAMQCPEATMVAGYKKWQKEFNRQVKKGEKAIKILAPMTCKSTRIVKDENGNEQEQEVKYTIYKPVPVFDLSQTEGDEMPNICNKLEGDQGAELIEKVKSISPVPVSSEPLKGGVNGFFHHDGYIVIDSNLSATQTLKTLIHEIAHAKLHNNDSEFADADRNTKEVQAESVAFTVCNYFGIDSSDYSFGYIAGWSKGRELEELRESLEIIRQTASEMIDGIAA